jgi:hypothetical protein
LAIKELDALFKAYTDVDIHLFKLDEFEQIELSAHDLNCIAFMIEE